LFPPVNGKHLKNQTFSGPAPGFGPWAMHFGRVAPGF
jgi:hypothetical protein